MENQHITRVCSSGRSLAECVADYNLPGNPELYEKLAEDISYKAPAHCADILSSLLLNDKKTASVLDVAAGPGQVGQELRRVGFERIDAHDGSYAMLETCRQKKIYNNFICCLIDDNTHLPVEDNTYDAVTVSGAILEHHLPPSSQAEIARVAKSRGYIVISYSTDILDTSYGMRWQDEANNLLNKGVWDLHGRMMIPEFYSGVQGVIEVFQKSSPCNLS